MQDVRQEVETFFLSLPTTSVLQNDFKEFSQIQRAFNSKGTSEKDEEARIKEWTSQRVAQILDELLRQRFEGQPPTAWLNAMFEHLYFLVSSPPNDKDKEWLSYHAVIPTSDDLTTSVHDLFARGLHPRFACTTRAAAIRLLQLSHTKKIAGGEFDWTLLMNQFQALVCLPSITCFSASFHSLNCFLAILQFSFSFSSHFPRSCSVSLCSRF